MTASTTTTKKQLVPLGSESLDDHFWEEQDVSRLIDLIENYQDSFEVVKVVYTNTDSWDNDYTLRLKFYRYETDDEVAKRVAKAKTKAQRAKEARAKQKQAQEERERAQYERLRKKYE